MLVRTRSLWSIVTAMILLCVGQSSLGQIVVERVGEEDDGPSRLILPYAFRTETFDASVGLLTVIGGWPQEHSSCYATAFMSANGSWRIWAGAYDLKMPLSDRLFLTPDIAGTDYRKFNVFVDGNPDYPDVRAGSNESEPDDFLTDEGWDGSLRLSFRYVLPWGHGKENIINRVTVKKAQLVSDPSGGTSWSPLKSGRSYLFIEPFFRNQELDLEDENRRLRSNGVRLEYRHDNTDFILNPSFGSRRSIAITRDWGLFDSTAAWTHIEADYRKFLSLGESKRHLQRVVGLTAWISDVPTWKTRQEEDGTVRVTQAPPYFEGSTLGGFYKMRAYPASRFSDRSAVYYSVEYRAMPRWNPLEGVSIFDSPEIEGWQYVVFCEAGRVAEDFDLDELHTDMKVDAGFGIRIFSGGLVGRLDMARAEEEWALSVMVGQSF